MIIAGVFASEALDSSGEVLDVKGADISDFEEGRGVVNYEHRSAEEEKIPGAEIVGKIIHAHKVYAAKDCRNALEKEAWERIEMPFIWGVVRLLDAAGHPGAINLAASIRDAHANDEPVTIGFSIEGSTLDRGKGSDSHILKRTMARRVALTFRPCNKTSQLALVADPKAPEGFDKMPGTKGVLEQTLKTEDPMYRRLGGYENTVRFDDLQKALTAGGYDAAPGTLTGGAALQVEHLSGRRRHLRNQVSAAIRDWDKKTPLGKFLKARLPDVDEGFLEKFADIARQHALAKAELLIKKKVDAAKKVKPQKEMDLGAEAKPDLPKEPKPLSIRGLPISRNPHLDARKAAKGEKRYEFDSKAGILHSPGGSIPAYDPSKDKPEHFKSFMDALNDKDNTEAHDYALDQWMDLHKKFKSGEVDPKTITHALAFAMMSPTTPVPIQELMHGHFVDMLHHSGFDPTKKVDLLNPEKYEHMKDVPIPKHPVKDEPAYYWDEHGLPKDKRGRILYELHRDLSPYHQDWKGRDHPQNFPETSPEHWKRIGQNLRVKGDTPLRHEGDLNPFSMTEDKFRNIAMIPQFHKELTDLVKKHGGDAQAMANDLMKEKDKYHKHEAKRQTAIASGKPDIGEYQGVKLAGLAPKTIRYMLGMIGGGNVIVPDTHFVRHFYGLDRDKDAATIDHIREPALWNDKNAGDLLTGMEEWYKHHPAVTHMMQHPKYGAYFREHPQEALFPAFWKHWMTIEPHEASRGMAHGAQNQATTHRVYFEGLKRSEEDDDVDPKDPLAIRTAMQHLSWAKKYGDMPALMMYLRFLAPQHKQKDDLKGKLKKATELMKGFDRLMTDPEKKPVQFQGKRIQPGLATLRSKYVPGQVQEPEHYSILGHTPTHLLGVKGENVNPDTVNHADLVRIPRSEIGVTKPSGKRLSIAAYPKDLDESPMADADAHSVGEYNHRPASRALIHGLTMNPGSGQGDVPADFDSAQAAVSYWTRNPQGKRVFVKGGEHTSNGLGSAKAEGAFYNLAHDFFGLGHYLPAVGVVRHPQTGAENAVIENVRNAQHYEPERGGGDPQDFLSDDQAETMKRLHSRGDLHKMAIMDYVLGNADRNDTNFLFTSDEPGFKLIDHGQAFSHDDDRSRRMPSYMKLNRQALESPLHRETHLWLKNLHPADLVHHMRRLEIPEPEIRHAVKRLEGMKDHAFAKPGSAFGHLFSRAQPLYNLDDSSGPNDVTKAEPEDGHGRLMQAVRGGLSDELRRAPWQGQPNCMAGHCYVATEALFHLLGGRQSGYVPHQLQHEGASHWFLKNPSTGHVLDPTAEQFSDPVPYNNARGKGFLTAKPSRRAQVVIDRAIARGKTPAGAP